MSSKRNKGSQPIQSTGYKDAESCLQLALRVLVLKRKDRQFLEKTIRNYGDIRVAEVMTAGANAIAAFEEIEEMPMQEGKEGAA